MQPSSFPDPVKTIEMIELQMDGWQSEVHPQIRRTGSGVLTFRSVKGVVAVTISDSAFVGASFVSTDGENTINRVETLEELSEIA